MFGVDAVIKRLGQPGSFTADAIVKRTNQPGSFTADAIRKRTFFSPLLGGAFVQDAFGRTISVATNNWGSADIGGAYSHLWTSLPDVNPKYEVTDGEAVSVFNASVSPAGGAAVGQAGAGSREILFRMKRSALTSPAVLTLNLRRLSGAWSNGDIDSGYMVRLVFGSSAANNSFNFIRQPSTITVSGTIDTGDAGSTDWVWFRCQIASVSPTQLRGKMWVDGDPEPDWQYDGVHRAQAPRPMIRPPGQWTSHPRLAPIRQRTQCPAPIAPSSTRPSTDFALSAIGT